MYENEWQNRLDNFNDFFYDNTFVIKIVRQISKIPFYIKKLKKNNSDEHNFFAKRKINLFKNTITFWAINVGKCTLHKSLISNIFDLPHVLEKVRSRNRASR